MMLHAKSRKLILASFATALLIGGGVAYTSLSHETQPAPLHPVVAEGLAALPSTTTSDWVTYSDHVIVATVASEREVPPSAREIEVGEGLIGREVTLRVDQVVWSRLGAPQIPSTLTLDVAGWTFKGDRRGEFSVEGMPRLAVGSTYLLPVALFNEPEAGLTGWGPLGPGTIFAFVNGQVTSAASDPAQLYPSGGIASAILGKPTFALLTTLTQAVVDPLAIPFMILPPTQRYTEVSRIRSGN